MVDNPRTTDEQSAVADTGGAADEPATARSPHTAAPADPAPTAEADDAVAAEVTRGEYIDFGSLALRLPAGARPRVTGTPGSASHALYLRVPEGHISVSVLAAPANRPLWPEFAEAISSAVQGGEGSVLTEAGEWGTEVQSGSGGELTWYIGRDGPLWLLYGTATGPAEHSARLASSVRALLREAQVRRGHESLPDKITLPLRLPPGYPEPAERAGDPGHGGRARNRTVASAAEADPRQPELKPLPGPSAASWHPSYHGTGPQQPVRPAPAPQSPPDDGGGTPAPRGIPAASQWPEWLDDPFAPAPGEAAAETTTAGRHARPESRWPKTRTLLIVGALILLIGGLGTIASLTGAIHISSRTTASDAQPAIPALQAGNEPSAIGPPAEPAPSRTPPSPGAPLPGLLGQPAPGGAPGSVSHSGPRGGGLPAEGSAPGSGRHSTADHSPGGPGQGDSAHVARAPSRQRSTSHDGGTRSAGAHLEATERHSNRSAGNSGSNRGRHDAEDSESRDGHDEDAECDCDDDRSSRRASEDGPLRHHSGSTTAGRSHGPLLGLLDSALGAL